MSELIASSVAVEAVFSTDVTLLDSLMGGFRKESVSAKELERMSSLSTPSAILALARIPTAPAVQWDGDAVLALDGIADPGNMGTIVRTALWFGFRQILCSPDCTDPYGPKVVQGAMGALFNMAVIPCDLVDQVRNARSEGYGVLTATLQGESVHASELPGRVLLVIGSESHGVSDDIRALCDRQVCIPAYGDGAESLNAAIAAGILMAEIRRRNGGEGN